MRSQSMGIRIGDVLRKWRTDQPDRSFNMALPNRHVSRELVCHLLARRGWRLHLSEKGGSNLLLETGIGVERNVCVYFPIFCFKQQVFVAAF